MDQQRKRWIVKTDEGVLRGPYSTDEVLGRISGGQFSGDELISKYPGADWFPISQDPQFYDRLLEALSGGSGRVAEDADDSPPAPSARSRAEKVSGELTPTPALEDEIRRHRGENSRTAHHERSGAHDAADVEAEDLSEKTPEPAQRGSARKERDSTADKKREREKSKSKSRRSKRQRAAPDDIEMVDTHQRVKEEVRKRAWRPMVAAAIVLAAGIYLLMGEEERHEERIHLLAPQKSKTTLPADQVRTRLNRSVGEYQRDTFSGYVRAENELVQVIEGSPQNAEVMALLCLTYFELWPFAFQDSTDLKVVSHVTQAVSAVDPSGPHSAACKSIDLMLKGRYGEAKSLVETTMEAYGSSSQPPIPFYYIKAILLDAANDVPTALGYLTSATQLWPQWTRAYVYQAQLLTRQENYAEAGKIYREVLKANPQHSVAKIELGILEYKYFHNPAKGEELINAGVGSSDRVNRKILSRGHLGLAELALARRDQSGALAEARKAYGADSTNALAKNLVVQLGGSGELKKTKFKAYQLIAEGDQFYREGDCNSAQAHYKAAFESDPKSAVAAMKAGECLWRISLSSEAIDWMNKAIRADPKLVEAYVQLADYYTQRYNFLSAAQVLAAAQREVPRSYEVLRGFALVELRRRNAKDAVSFAKQALALYDTDVDSHIIMAEALIDMNNSREAYAHATRAVELDVNNRRAQIVYGRALAGIQGVAAGIDFFTRMVTTYPLVADYRLALGKLLAGDERYSQAEGVFRQLTQIEERSKEAYLELGKVLRRQSRYEDALQALLQAAVLDPADAEPLFEAGLLYLEINKPDEARVQFQRVLRINKLYPLVHYHIGRAALLLKDAQEALKEAKEERNINPNMADAYLLAAEAYTQTQQYSLCVSEYQKAIKLRPQSAQIYLKVAQCYRKADQLDVAISMLNQAAVMESGMADIYKELGVIYEIKGDLTKAIESYNQYFVLDPNAADKAAIEQRIKSLQRRGGG